MVLLSTFELNKINILIAGYILYSGRIRIYGSILKGGKIGIRGKFLFTATYLSVYIEMFGLPW